MNDFPEFDTIEKEIEEQVKHLDFVHHEVARLQREREQAEKKIVKLLNHTIKAQRTYVVGIHAIEISTGLLYSLDKKKYEVLGDMLPDQFNPVQIKEAFYLDKKKIELCREFGTIGDNEIIDEIITTKDKKLSIKIFAAKGSK